MRTLGVVGIEEEIGVDEYHRRAAPSSRSSRPPMSSMSNPSPDAHRTRFYGKRRGEVLFPGRLESTPKEGIHDILHARAGPGHLIAQLGRDVSVKGQGGSHAAR